MRLLPKLCSSKWKTANEEAKSKGLGGNLKGDGGQTGGVLVVGQGGAPTMFTYKQVGQTVGYRRVSAWFIGSPTSMAGTEC